MRNKRTAGTAAAALCIAAALIPTIWLVILCAQNPEGAREILWEEPFTLYRFWNSLLLCSAITLGQMLVSCWAGFALAKYPIPGKGYLTTLLVILMLLPLQVTLVPSYLILDALGLLNTIWALILPSVFSPFGTVVMWITFRAVPEDLLDAARLDGASEWRIYFQLVLPNIKPAVLTVFIFQFVNIWNGLSKELVYDEQLKVVKVALEQISASNLYARMGSGMAGSVLLMIPPIVIFILMQRHVVETMTFAGMKEG